MSYFDSTVYRVLFYFQSLPGKLFHRVKEPPLAALTLLSFQHHPIIYPYNKLITTLNAIKLHHQKHFNILIQKQNKLNLIKFIKSNFLGFHSFHYTDREACLMTIYFILGVLFRVESFKSFHLASLCCTATMWDLTKPNSNMFKRCLRVAAWCSLGGLSPVTLMSCKIYDLWFRFLMYKQH